MFRRYPAALAVLLLATVTSLAHAQQAAGDSTRRDRAQDQRTITHDTVTLHREMAVRDSLRRQVKDDHADVRTDEKRVDSLQTALRRDRKAAPGDTARVRTELASLQQKLRTDRQDIGRDEKRLDFTEKQLHQESHAVIAAHHDVREDRAKRAHPDSSTHH